MKLPPLKEDWLAHDALWISVLAQLGYMLRWSLAVALGDRCERWEWAACISANAAAGRGGALFIDLPANSLGCFVVGLLSASATLNLRDGKKVGMLSEKHWFQRAKALQTGLRTGFCGCLTSYASWMTQVSLMIYGLRIGTTEPPEITRSWPSGLFAILLGLQAMSSSLAAGTFIARRRALMLQPAAQGESGGKGDAPDSGSDETGGSSGEGGKPTKEELQRSGHAEGQAGTKRGSGNVLDEPAEGNVQGSNRGNGLRRASAHEPGADQVKVPITQAENDEPNQEPQWSRQEAVPPTNDSEASPSRSMLQTRLFATAALAFAGLLALATGMCVRAFRNSDFDGLEIWLGTLLAPPFALIRWQLGGLLNEVPKKRNWKGLTWLPLGTFTANFTACVVDYALLAAIYRAKIEGVVRGILAAVKGGAMGSLSTVSTFAVEIAALAQDGMSYSALFCIVFVIVTTQLYGLALYAWVPFSLASGS